MEKLTLTNDTSDPLEVWVECRPDRFVLQLKEEMVIEAEADPSQDYFHINIYDGGVQVYPPGSMPHRVTINGQVAKPEWPEPGT